MAQKFTPLNLSFLSNQYSPQRDSIANTAAMIMANAGWSKPSQVSLREIAKAQSDAKKAYNSAHKQSFLSSVFDAIQTPLYGVANALDEAIAGHQGDSNDNFIEDIGKSIGGLGTGAVRGIGAGLRGATGILDALPGVDISDDWQSNPEDKTHMGDVLLRKITGLSTENAMKPENLEKVKAALEKFKSPGPEGKSFGEVVLSPLLPDPDSATLQKDLYRNVSLGSIPFDVAMDPLNAVALPGRASALTSGATEGVEAARSTGSTVDAIKSGLNLKAADSFDFKAPLNQAAPVAALPENIAPVAGTSANVTTVAPEAVKGFKNLGNLGRRETPVQGVEVPIRDQQKMVKDIATAASHNPKDLFVDAAAVLGRHPNVDWTETEKFIRGADRAVKSKGLKHNPARMAPVLAEKISQDVKAMRTSGDVERRVMNSNTDVVIRPNGPRLKVPEARLANSVVRKFEGEILGRSRAPGTGENLARAIAQGRNVRYSGPQQARMWNQITSSLKYADARKFDKAVRVLRSVEDYFITKGVIPHSAAKTTESVPLRLSQVAEALGPQVLGKSHAFITGILRGDPKSLAQLTPEQVESIRALRASEAVAAAPAVQSGINQAKNAADQIAKLPMSVGRKVGIINSEAKRIGEFVAQQGGGDSGAHVAQQYFGNLLGRTDPINSVMRANKFKTEEWLSKTGRNLGGKVNDPDFLKSVTNAISKAADLPTPASLSGATGAAAKVSEWLGARFNAAYGIQDMRPIFEVGQAGAMSTTARRARLINDLGRRFDPKDADLWHEAFRSAQQNGITDGRIAELQSEIGKVMENLFGGTGLRSGAVSDSTIVGRNRLLLDELNKNLKRFGLSKFQFEAGKKVKAADGTVHDFSEGMDWLKSWEIWDVTKPYEFLHKVQNAVEFTVREKTMFDEIASRFGSATKSGNVKYGIAHPRLGGYFFTSDAAEQGKLFVRMLEEISTPNSKSLQYFDHVLSKLKASLTIYIPGHHMTNLIGDTYYNWIAGVNKPIRYEQAMKVMLAQKGRYGEFAEIGKLNPNALEALSGPKALEQAVARSMVKPNAGLDLPAAGNRTIVTMQNGTKVTADMVYTAAFREGILPSAKVLEDVTSDATSVLDKFRPLGGRGQRVVHNVSEVRDHIPRLAQFIDGIAKSKGSFSQGVTSAAKNVRKWHPDGLGLTTFERTVMKRVFPFYSWTRKAIPLAIESAVFAGPKVMAYPRLMEAIALANGIDPSQAISDPFPNDQMFPDWLRARGIGPIMGGAGSYGVVNPSTPVIDTLALIGQPGQSSLDMLNPMLKVPIETANGSTLGRNVPIGTSNADWLDYFSKQIPVASQLGRASGQFGVSDSTQAEGFPNWTNILNLLTGAKMVNTGKYQKSAQFDLRDYLKQKGQQQG